MSPLPAAVPAVPPAHAVPVVAPVAATAAPHGWTSVTVRDGDTVYAIALKYRTSVAAIVTHNRLRDGGHLIHPGQRLLVPRASSTAAAPATSTPRPAPASTSAYTVRNGDTMWAIALRHKVGLAALLKANGLSATSLIHPGQVIRIPGAGSGAGKPAPSTAPKPATVAKPALTASVATIKAYLASVQVPSRTATRDLIVATARRHGVDPKLALAIGWQESGWNQRAVSHAKAIGVMQVIPLSGTWASELLGRRVDLLDTKDNVEAGVVILRSLTRSTTNEDIAIAAYYQGLHSVTTRGMYTDTKAYVAAVKAHRARM